MFSLIKSTLTPTKKPVHKRTSILNNNCGNSERSITHKRESNPALKIMSEFSDEDIIQDTPLSFLIRRVRQLEELTYEDIELLKCLDSIVLIDLLIEYNYYELIEYITYSKDLISMTYNIDDEPYFVKF